PDGSKDGKLVFRQKLFNQENFNAKKKEEVLSSLDFSDTTVHVKLNDLYSRNKFVRFWMGDNYRDVWNQAVELPVFDIASEKGGLEILKRGGGQQTRSVRMKDKNGKQYVLRSVNKYVEKALGEELRNTIAEDAVQDAISASHPFAALTVPNMAEAAGVMHTNPKIVWVPDDPRLGIYRKDLANNIFLFEERPAGNRDDVDSFGNAEKIVNTLKVVEKTQEEHDHIVDQEAVLKARLFDMLLNDWDRHDDQWRWASFKEKDIRIYRPIPRDRDQVYFVNQGAVMWLASQDFIMPKFQGFDHEIKNVKGLGYNARYFDRSFITEPDLDKWLATSKSICDGITNDVIHDAISKLPDEIYEVSGKSIEDKLKSRKNSLDIYAEQYYRFLSKEVDVVGTDNRELFKIQRLENGNTDVSVFVLSDKKGKIKEQFYHREFKPDETKEIRLYGLDGKDKFEISGLAKKAIKIRLVPGKNNDSVIDNSSISGFHKTILVYDRKDKKNYIQKGKETKLKLSKDKSVDNYNRKQYKYDKTLPLFDAGYNIDDGIFIGGGVHINRFNFRDSSFHKITGTWAFETNAFAINYYGLVSSFSQFFDLEIDAGVSMPRNVDNYFGMGNETKRKTDDKSFYRIRYEYNYINPMLKHTVGKSLNYRLGMFYHYFEVQDTADRFIADPEISGLDTMAYFEHHFAGLNAAIEIDTRNSKVLPQRGLHWTTEAIGYCGVGERARSYVKLKSDMSFYLSFTSDPRVVFALRFGGAMNLGDYEFYHANALGGKTNLRGFQSRRFAGDQSFYQNTEIRFKLLNLKNYIFNGQTGFYVFNDIGRVWLDGEDSERWHDGYGFGVWLTPFEFTALTFSYNRSYDDEMLVFNFKFLF
ncbi:MAG: outer membrane protein assembly factor, partial [Bacteroidales bacterium]|nr:outer membrane protein assembly factor [Bacteroidales bacterium]